MERHSGEPIYLNRIPLTLTGKRDFCIFAHLLKLALLYSVDIVKEEIHIRKQC